ncbi:MAG: 4-(cytidine 5'-diphospho)-2-C-methyl-D-erythritol kinase [Actinomycetaceae bacterium]|nr:4-(cytidine 5'-diphospho)-2-C-methyl-D-erythritol kinase [Actinomycetaceae bacterium]MDY5854344.1 4-(cytidine 5'-diphospho)-2-C-methyl-D-erythritol kinase [Arcanobacterium sp.]
MRYVRALAPAKVNLALRVGAARSDGFHPLDTVFEALDICEQLEVWDDPSGDITLTFAPGLGEHLPVDERNLAVRAALELRRHCGIGAGAKLHIRKRIPIAGGMAGGSADAAAALVGLNELWQTGLSESELSTIGARLGSDVPFALLGGVAHGTGRGEQLRSVPTQGEHGFVMLANPQGLSTPAVFRQFDVINVEGDRCARAGEPASTQELREALAGVDMDAGETRKSARGADVGADFSADPGSDSGADRSGNFNGNRSLDLGSHNSADPDGHLSAIGALMVNDLEAPAFALRPDLEQIVGQLRNIVRVRGRRRRDAEGAARDAAADISPSAGRQTEFHTEHHPGCYAECQAERQTGWNTAKTQGELGAPMFGVILSGSGPTVAVLCAPVDAAALAAELSERFPELMPVAAHGPASGARVVEVRES